MQHRKGMREFAPSRLVDMAGVNEKPRHRDRHQRAHKLSTLPGVVWSVCAL